MANKTHLWIAGHGETANGGFDPGATGYITKGEHLYYEENFFPAAKEYIKNSKDTFILFSAHNVFSHNTLVQLVNKYNVDTVTEWHYDSFTENARGGHVIVHADFNPDALDLAIRDVIDKNIGVRYSHRGEKGISGRTNLRNVNLAKKHGINYRLVELGFCSNRQDASIMINKVDDIARMMVEAHDGLSHPTVEKPKEPSKPAKGTKQTLEEVAKDISEGRGDWGNNPERDKKLKAAGYDAAKVQARVNDILGFTTKKPKQSVEEVAQDIAKGRGDWGNYPARAEKLRKAGYNPSAVQSRVNAILKSNTTSSGPSLNVDWYARQVIKGIDHNGRKIPTGRSARAKHFGLSMSDYDRVQVKVNQLLK